MSVSPTATRPRRALPLLLAVLLTALAAVIAMTGAATSAHAAAGTSAAAAAGTSAAAAACTYAPTGDIATKYNQLGGASGPLGCAKYNGSKATADGVGQYTEFDGGDIYWTASTGAHDIRGPILTKWASYGWEQGLGYPTTDQTTESGGYYNTFTKGAIHYSSGGGAVASGRAVNIQNLALANIGGMACQQNSLGGTAFYGSCTGNGGQPEYWCADFAKWVWANSGVSNLSGLNALAASFYGYGQTNHTLSAIPSVGAAVVFSTTNSTSNIHHVAIVTAFDPVNKTIETASGDWGGESGTEAHFSATSHVIHNLPAYSFNTGTKSSTMGQYVVGYITAT